MTSTTLSVEQPAIWRQFWRLTKPRVVALIVFTAILVTALVFFPVLTLGPLAEGLI